MFDNVPEFDLHRLQYQAPVPSLHASPRKMRTQSLTMQRHASVSGCRSALRGALGVPVMIAVFLATTAAAQAQRINVYTSEYFDDINPLMERRYVSRWLGELVAARLFRQSCRTESAQIQILPECALDSVRMERDKIRLDARRQHLGYRCPIPEGKEPRDFILNSVDKTIKLLNNKALQRNFYHGNGFRITGTSSYPELQIATPPNVGEKGLQFLDFPLFSDESEVARQAIPPNHAKRLDELTFGSWHVGAATNQNITLRLRYEPARLVPPGLPFDQTRSAREIQIRSAEPSQMARVAIRARGEERQAANIANLGHVFLNIAPAMARVIGDNYNPAFAQAAEGPFYLGFNFDRAPSSSTGQLFDSEEFRRLFAQSLWSIPVFGDQFSGLARIDDRMDGVWPGQSLLSLQNGSVTRLASAALASEIQSFLKRNENTYVAVNLRIWITPEGSRMFDRSGVEQLKGALNNLWVCDQRCGQRTLGNEVGVFFKFLPLSNAQQQPSADYDLVIDRMVHGGRPTRIADAVEPGDSANITRLTNRHITAQRRALWRTETSAAKADLTRWLKEQYYFIVIGEYRFRDLYFQEMTGAAAAAYCQDGGKLLHPMGAHLWELPR